MVKFLNESTSYHGGQADSGYALVAYFHYGDGHLTPASLRTANGCGMPNVASQIGKTNSVHAIRCGLLRQFT